MQALAPHFSVNRDDDNREVHWTAAGLWDSTVLTALQADLFVAAQPFIEDKGGFRVLGDLREFAVQSRDMIDAIREQQSASAKLGVDRMAIVYSSMLVKQQLRRLSEELDIQFFDNKSDAVNWLRAPKGL